MLDIIKVLLGLGDSSKDDLLEELISLKSRKLQSALYCKIIPESLEYIVIELVVAHYNKLGSEGLASESVEGITRTYADSANELEPYQDIIKDYNKPTFRIL